MKTEVEGLISCKKLISVNAMYTIKKGSRQKILSDEARYEKAQLWSSLRSSGVELHSLDNTDKIFKLTVIVYITKNYFKRDCDNFNKIVQDVISEALGFNDSRIVTVTDIKKKLVNTPKDCNEYLYYKLESFEDKEFNQEIDYESLRRVLQK